MFVAVKTTFVTIPSITEGGSAVIVQPPVAALAGTDPMSTANSAEATTGNRRLTLDRSIADTSARSGDPLERRPQPIPRGGGGAGQRRVRSGSEALDEQGHERLVELAAGAVLEPAQRLVESDRLAIRPGRRHRRHRVADRE